MAEDTGNNQGPTGQPSQDTKPDKKVSDQNQRYNKKKHNKGGKPHGGTTKTSSFKGALADLNGHVFELGSETTKSNQ